MSTTVHTFVSRLALALAGLLLASVVLAQAVDPTVQVRYDGQLGHYLTGPDGMALYYFGNDTDGVSNCSGGCLENWPPLLADEVVTAPLSIPGEFGLIERPEGMQVTYNGLPLYYFVRDEAPGDTNGQNVGNVWWVATPQPTVQTLETAAGTILVGPTGMTLYTFDSDTENTSNCAGGCAKNWPPLVGGWDPENGFDVMQVDGVGTLGLISRADGGMQVTLDGQPLYYWIRDKVPGDTTGDGVGGNWHIVVLDGGM